MLECRARRDRRLRLERAAYHLKRRPVIDPALAGFDEGGVVQMLDAGPYARERTPP